MTDHGGRTRVATRQIGILMNRRELEIHTEYVSEPDLSERLIECVEAACFFSE